MLRNDITSYENNTYNLVIMEEVNAALAHPKTDEYAELRAEVERLKTLVESYQLGSANRGGGT
jgi:hypothetical protein